MRALLQAGREFGDLPEACDYVELGWKATFEAVRPSQCLTQLPVKTDFRS